jgi:hypothetical protein
MVKQMIKITKLICVLIVTLTLGGCWNGPYEDTASMYLQRSDTITLSAGNAKDANAVTHIIDPWPRGGGNRRIQADGERMVGAVQRYKSRPAAKAGSQSGSGDTGAVSQSGISPASGTAASAVTAH